MLISSACVHLEKEEIRRRRSGVNVLHALATAYVEKHTKYCRVHRPVVAHRIVTTDSNSRTKTSSDKRNNNSHDTNTRLTVIGIDRPAVECGVSARHLASEKLSAVALNTCTRRLSTKVLNLLLRDLGLLEFLAGKENLGAQRVLGFLSRCWYASCTSLYTSYG
jgi:hypothetical protein